MQKTFLFPGQGTQKVGMGADLRDAFASAKKRFEQVNEILGRDLTSIIFDGSDEELRKTGNTQPALFAVEAVICDVLKENGVTPSYCLGHSLGEYSALYAAGAYSFEDGLRIVARRGELMSGVTGGTMAAVIGLDRATIAKAIADISSGVVVPANENSPEQTVISGDIAAVNDACEKLRAVGAKRVVPLSVSGAFHSPLMQPAADAFQEFLEPFVFADTKCPVVPNVTAKPETRGPVLKEQLVRQLLSRVRWVDSMATVVREGEVSCLEVGPGAVLKGLARKCAPGISVVSCESADNVFSITQSGGQTRPTPPAGRSR